ncbi:MAG TPA: glucose 1-dehydrogenase [Dehalococcoidia bacterium]|nr:glucose 1-dehydrogenase [Dehalococcoidia bacterium]
MKLDKKVAVVTGAGRGIGKAIANRFAEEGARVIVSDIELSYAENVAGKLKRVGWEVLAFKADVSSWYEVAQMFKVAEKRYGGVDILVNNAGIRRDAPLHKMSEDDWDSAIATQVRGSFNCARAAQKYMVRQNYGKIVNISSAVPASLGERGQTAYASASAAVQGFTKALALELGRYGINVNCICPEYIDTEMARNSARKEGMYLDDYRRFATARIPLKRMGTPEDIANVALFLVSDESSFISGQVINVRGGP